MDSGIDCTFLISSAGQTSQANGGEIDLPRKKLVLVMIPLPLPSPGPRPSLASLVGKETLRVRPRPAVARTDRISTTPILLNQHFCAIDDRLCKEACCGTELDYTEQTSWLLFRKDLDGLVHNRASMACWKSSAPDTIAIATEPGLLRRTSTSPLGTCLLPGSELDAGHNRPLAALDSSASSLR